MATFTVTNLFDSGAGSLRAAITAANAASPGSPNTIDFTVSGTITLQSDLPSITNPTSIVAASTTVGSAPTVEINFNGHAGLTFDGGSQGSQLIGLALGGASGAGVTLNAGNILLNNNYIGLALDGTALGNSGDGVFVASTSSGNQIGSNPDALSRVVTNVISNNGGNGITFNGSADNVVESNRIGTNVAGTAAMANAGNGIWLTGGANGNLIGGTASFDSSTGQQNDPTGDKGTTTATIVTPALGNLVSGNGADGIRIDTGSENNVLSGNFVGTDVTGNAALGNTGDGVAINGADNNSLIGCTFVDNPFIYYNVVSGNGGNGIHVTNADNTLIQANFAGVGANNAVIVANGNDGILVDGSSANTQVGGVIPLGNVISGNTNNGIEVKDTASGFTTFNTFGGVYAFQGAAPNGNDGVLITATGGNQIVRTNVLSGNLNNGLEIAGDASGVTVVPNIIGLNTRGDGIIANGGNGVLITGTAHDNIVGGSGGDQVSVIRQNTLSGNDGYGLAITGQAYNNVVTDSAIGTDIQETGALANGAGGVLVSSTGHGNVIGSPITGGSPVPSPAVLVNIISGNDGNGVTLAPGASLDAVINNWIGLDITGAGTLPNTGAPIQTNGSYNLIYGNASTGALPAESMTAQLEALYIGWYGWAADPGSYAVRLQTLMTDILQGASVSAAALAISEEFATSPEESVYASLASLVTPVTDPTPEQIALANSFVDQTYNNLFGRAATDGEKLTWRTVLFDGTVPFSAMVYDIANGASGPDVTAINSKIDAAAYFTAASDHGSAGIAAVSGVVDTTTALASQAATDALNGSSHQQVDYSSILTSGSITTGVRADLNGAVILTGSQPTGVGNATEAYLYEGPLNDTAAGTRYILTPTFAGETITTATLYGPDTAIFTPSIGAGNVRAVGSYQYAESPSGTLNHGMMYQGPVNGSGGTWTQIDVPTDGTNVVGGIVLGGQIEDTILHSTMGDLVVGNYDMVGPGGTILGANGFIYNIATHQYTLLSINGSIDNETSVYGIWENGVGSTSYTIAGGTFVAGDGINEAFLEDYDSQTGVFSNLRFYTGDNRPGVITHFENITAVPGGYDLVATTDSGPAFVNVTRNADGSFGSATWVDANLPGTSTMTGNIAYQNVIGGIYNTSGSSAEPSTYLGTVDLSHVTSAGGLIMPMGSFNFAYALTVNGSVGDLIEGSGLAGNVLGGSIGNDAFVGTAALDQPDTIFTGGGADAIALALGHTASDRIELYAGNSLANAAVLAPGGVVASVSGSIVDAADVPQLGWWGQATAQSGGPVSNATTNAGLGTGTSQDMSTLVNFATTDTIDISLSAFSNLVRDLKNGGAPSQGTAVFSNLVHPGGTVTVADANVLLIDSPTGFLNAADVAATLLATPITFAGIQTNSVNHYIIAYQDVGGNVRIADMDIHASGSFTKTSQAQTLSISDMVQLTGVSLSSLQASNINFLTGSAPTVVSSGQTVTVSAGQTTEGVVVLSGGTLDVASGGIIDSTTVQAGGGTFVSSGGLASGVSVSGLLSVLPGGSATNVAVASGGTAAISGAATSVSVSTGQLTISGTVSNAVWVPDASVYLGVGGSLTQWTASGGTAVFDGTATSGTIASGAGVFVSSGGSVNGSVVQSGGGLFVLNSGTASGTTVLGREEVLPGGTTSDLVIGSRGVGIVGSGGSASGTIVSQGGLDIVDVGGVETDSIVSSGGTEFVYGTATSTTVASGGGLFVLSGGIAGATVVQAGGGLFVSSAGIGSNSTVLGREEVLSGGIGRNMAVGSGGLGVVSSGGAASGTTVSNGGLSVVDAGGVETSATVSSGGTEFVYGSTTSGTIGSGGGLFVYGGGLAAAAIVQTGGGLFVSSGGVASSTTVLGREEVASGGIERGATIGNGGLNVVSSGGVASGIVVSGGGINVVAGGGGASGTIVSSGGTDYIYGSASAGSVASGGGGFVLSGGVASGGTIAAGGGLFVSSGGIASGTIVSGREEFLSGGVGRGISVASGGLEVVSSGGVTTGTTVGSGGTDVVDAGGVESGTVVSTGGQAFDYGSAVSGTVATGGALYVIGGATGTTVQAGGGLFVWSGGVASGGTVLGRQEVLSGGTERGATVGNGGTHIVSSGGVTTGTTVGSGGTDVVVGGGVESAVIVSSGGTEFVYGATTGGTVAGGGAVYVFSNGAAAAMAVQAGGGLFVSSGGVASGGTVLGRQEALFGGIERGATVGNGGLNVVSSGGVSSDTVVSNGGIDVVATGGIASGTTVAFGGIDYVYGSAAAITVGSGGAQYVQSGATLTGATLSGGLIEILSGGTAGVSQINFTTGGTGGGVLQLDDSVHFNGVISGFGVPGSIDLRDIAFGSGTTLGFTEAGDNLSGTLTVSDGTNTANITLLGQYVAGNFTKQSDGNGGTLITDPPVVGQYSLYNPHA